MAFDPLVRSLTISPTGSKRYPKGIENCKVQFILLYSGVTVVLANTIVLGTVLLYHITAQPRKITVNTPLPSPSANRGDLHLHNHAASLNPSSHNDWFGNMPNYIPNIPLEALFKAISPTSLDLMPVATTWILNQRTRPEKVTLATHSSSLLLSLFDKKEQFLIPVLFLCKCLDTSEIVGAALPPYFAKSSLLRTKDPGADAWPSRKYPAGLSQLQITLKVWTVQYRWDH